MSCDSQFIDLLFLKQGVITKDVSEKSKTSSPGSSRSSWCNAGETMAFKDYSSNSMSSSDEYNSNLKQIKKRDEEDASSVTITAGHQSLLLCRFYRI